MKKFIYKIVTLTLISLTACESDDICDSTIATTPSLVIEVYDRTNTATLKSVTNLKVREINATSFMTFSESGTQFLNVNKFKLPLKNNSNSVKFELTLNGDLVNGQPHPAVNKDIITFNYTRKDIYISRACGFKTNFVMGDFTFANVDDFPGENFKWINNVQLINNSITNENEIHLKIFY